MCLQQDLKHRSQRLLTHVITSGLSVGQILDSGTPPPSGRFHLTSSTFASLRGLFHTEPTEKEKKAPKAETALHREIQSSYLCGSREMGCCAHLRPLVVWGPSEPGISG